MIHRRYGILFLALVTLLGFTLATHGPADTEAASSSAAGQLNGRVVSARTSQPVPFALVQVDGTLLSAVTDTAGYYSILNLPSGRYSVTVTAIGFATMVTMAVEVTKDSTTTVDFLLQASKSPADTVVVIAGSAVVDLNATGNKQTLTAKERGPRIAPQSAADSKIEFESSAHALGFRSVGSANRHEVSRYACPPAAWPGWNTEQYAHITENGFRRVTDEPLSTFSIDVDAASYANIRRFLNDGQMPPPDAVRIEEMINYFTYDYPQPDGDVPFSITTELSDCPWNPEHRLVHIGLQGRTMAEEDLPPSNLVFLLDVSGSMNQPNKLPLVQASMRMLVNQLRPQDRVAIVVYAGAAGLVLESTPGDHQRRILDAIDRLRAGGSTAGGAGIKLAYQVAWNNFIEDGNNRVILATDGDFNVGVSSDGALERLIEKERETGIFLTVLGFGTGNIKDTKMEILADKGNGNYAYIDNILEGQKVLVSEAGGTLFTIAKDVKIQVEFNPVRVAGYRLVGYENRLLANEDFNDDTKDAGELGSGHTVTALYELVPAGMDVPGANVDPLKYQTPRDAATDEHSDEVMTVKLRYKAPDGDRSRKIVTTVGDQDLPLRASSNNFRFSAAVAEFGMLLRHSPNLVDADYQDVMDLAVGSKGADVEGYRSEFIRLVTLAETISESLATR